MKKIVLVGLLVFLAAGLMLVGCAGKNSSANTLEIYSIQIDGDGPGTFQRAIDRFNKANPDINVTLNIMANDSYKQRLAVAMASGKTPDLFLTWAVPCTSMSITIK